MINAKNFALAGGILWAFVMFVVTILALYTSYADSFLLAISSIYPGYEITLLGAVVGAVYGFIDAFVGLYLFVWLYNKFNK